LVLPKQRAEQRIGFGRTTAVFYESKKMKRTETSDHRTEPLLFQAALEIQEFLSERNWQFAFIGGLALLRWGRRRMTEDVDGTLLTMFTDEEKYVDAILERFESRISAAREFALQNRVLLLTASNGVRIDFSLGGLPFERQAVECSSLYEYIKGCELRTCSAEDLIVFKAFAARDQDWADVRSVLERQKGKLNLDYVRQNLAPLVELKEAPEIIVRLENMIRNT
jgi:predicted nucleotidyltransferase